MVRYNTKGVVLVKTLVRPSIEEIVHIMEIDEKLSRTTPFKDYLLNKTLSKDRNKAHKLLRKVTCYLIQGDILYRGGFSTPLLRSFDPDEARTILEDVNEGSYDDHVEGQNLA